MLSGFPILTRPDSHQHRIFTQGPYSPSWSAVFPNSPNAVVQHYPECSHYPVEPVKDETGPDPALLLRTMDDEAADNDEPQRDVLDLIHQRSNLSI